MKKWKNMSEIESYVEKTRKYRLSVVNENNEEIDLVGYFVDEMDLINWISRNYKELEEKE